jgi:hypothetical protein
VLLFQDVLLELTGIDVRICPACHKQSLMRLPLPISFLRSLCIEALEESRLPFRMDVSYAGSLSDDFYRAIAPSAAKLEL